MYRRPAIHWKTVIISKCHLLCNPAHGCSDSIKLPRCFPPSVNHRLKMTASTVKSMLHVSKDSKKRVVLKKHDDFSDSLCYIRVRNSIWVFSVALFGGLTLVKCYLTCFFPIGMKEMRSQILSSSQPSNSKKSGSTSTVQNILRSTLLVIDRRKVHEYL